MNRQRLLGLSLVVAGCLSCTTEPRFRIGSPSPEERYIYPTVWVQRDSTETGSVAQGSVPFEIAFIVNYSTDRGGSTEELISRFEVNYNDGEGWQDVTSNAYNVWDYTLQDPSAREFHTFTEPGEYALSLRVTYWDGEVVYFNEDAVVGFVVTKSEPST